MNLRAHNKVDVGILHVSCADVGDDEDTSRWVTVVHDAKDAFAEAFEGGGGCLAVDAACAGVVGFECAGGDLLCDFGIDALTTDEEASFFGLGAVGEECMDATGCDFVAGDVVGEAHVGFGAFKEKRSHLATRDADGLVVARPEELYGAWRCIVAVIV